LLLVYILYCNHRLSLLFQYISFLSAPYQSIVIFCWILSVCCLFTDSEIYIYISISIYLFILCSFCYISLLYICSHCIYILYPVYSYIPVRYSSIQSIYTANFFCYQFPLFILFLTSIVYPPQPYKLFRQLVPFLPCFLRRLPQIPNYPCIIVFRIYYSGYRQLLIPPLLYFVICSESVDYYSNYRNQHRPIFRVPRPNIRSIHYLRIPQ